MKITSEVRIDESDVLKQIEELRLPEYTTLVLHLEGKEFTFQAHEWNRILNLAIKGYVEEA